MPDQRILVVGAGFSGSVIAERLANAGHEVLVVDRREHIGGNAYDELDRHGVLIHRYGPHIFHTSSEEVVAYLSRFTTWRPYEHRVLASIDVGMVPVPINLTTLECIFGREFDEHTAQAFLDEKVIRKERILTSEDLVLSRVGPEVYEKIFLNYTRKQWGVDPSKLDATVAGRIPLRFNRDDRYFTDTFQAMPSSGYTEMFKKMLDHRLIRVEPGVDFFTLDRTRYAHVVFTGPIDAYFGYAHGKLPYRSLDFEFIHSPGTCLTQPVGTVNYPNSHEFTRVTEFKHLTGQEMSGSTICREYPRAHGDPYYPVPAPQSRALYAKYEAAAEAISDVVTFAGRLGTYKYYNMDQVVAQALKTSAHVLSRLGKS